MACESGCYRWAVLALSVLNILSTGALVLGWPGLLVRRERSQGNCVRPAHSRVCPKQAG